MRRDSFVVFVVDDDSSVRSALQRFLRSLGLQVQTFASAEEFLTSSKPDSPSCLLLDLRMPGVSGLNLQRDLLAAHIDMPVIFMTGEDDDRLSTTAMKTGAVGVLTKPFGERQLLDAIERAFEHH